MRMRIDRIVLIAKVGTDEETPIQLDAVLKVVYLAKFPKPEDLIMETRKEVSPHLKVNENPETLETLNRTASAELSSTKMQNHLSIFLSNVKQ